ncbi:hypothetical protein KR018_000834, partial [Drosophila ironensis]
MPELLSGLALEWFIANNEHRTAWQDFTASFQVYFLPRDYFEKLEEEVRGRRQRPGEPFKRFMVKMQTLMRPLRYNLEDQLKMIQDRSLPDLRAYARPYNCRSIIELMRLAEEFEELKGDRERLRGDNRGSRMRFMVADEGPTAQETDAYWRCQDARAQA